MSEIVVPALIPKRRPVCLRRFRLRWVFEFYDRPTKTGVWDAASDRPTDGAWCIDKSKLHCARVESEDIADFSTLTMVEVAGQDYSHATWEVHTRAPALWRPDAPTSPIELTPRVHGLSLWTRDEKITAYVDGTVKRRLLTTDERTFDLTEHRLGAGLGGFR